MSTEEVAELASGSEFWAGVLVVERVNLTRSPLPKLAERRSVDVSPPQPNDDLRNVPGAHFASGRGDDVRDRYNGSGRE